MEVPNIAETKNSELTWSILKQVAILFIMMSSYYFAYLFGTCRVSCLTVSTILVGGLWWPRGLSIWLSAVNIVNIVTQRSWGLPFWFFTSWLSLHLGGQCGCGWCPHKKLKADEFLTKQIFPYPLILAAVKCWYLKHNRIYSIASGQDGVSGRGKYRLLSLG